MPTIGATATLYYLDASSLWVRITSVRNLGITMDAQPEDASQRGAGWTESEPGPIAAALVWDMIWDKADAALAVLRDAFLTGATVSLMALSGPIDAADATTDGIRMDCAIVGFSPDQKIRDALSVAIVAKPTISTTDPAWVAALIDIDNSELVWDIDVGELVVAE
jgi:hypothetical protein